MKSSPEKTPKEKLTIYLPEDLAWEMRRLGAERRTGKTDTDHIQEAVRSWVSNAADPEGVALELLRAYYDESRESARTFRTAFSRYRSELETREGQHEQEAAQSFAGSDRKPKKAGNAGRT